MTTAVAALWRWSAAAVAVQVLARIAARVLSARALRAMDPGDTDFGGDD